MQPSFQSFLNEFFEILYIIASTVPLWSTSAASLAALLAKPEIKPFAAETSSEFTSPSKFMSPILKFISAGPVITVATA